MLRALHIRNFAIIDAIEIELETGFSVLSGETGAGKSILIDALGLVLGDRADPAQVRAGEAQAEITAEFALDGSLAARAWLREQAMEDADNANSCLIRRVVGSDGRSRAFINGAPASLANVRDLGERLVEIHGQNEHHALLRGDTQRDTLDEFGRYGTTLDAVAQAARAYAQAEGEIEKLKTLTGRDPAQLDYLTHQLRELEQLKLQDGDLAQLDAEQRRLANAGRLMEEGAQAQEQLYGAEGSLTDQLASVRALLAGLSALDPAFAEADAALQTAEVSIGEAADSVRRIVDKLDLDPGRLRDVERRLEAVHDLARKHRVRPDELLARCDALRTEVSANEDAAGAMVRLEARRADAAAAYRAAATKLTAARRKAAREFATKVTAIVRELGMAKAEFVVDVATAPSAKPAIAGDDDIRFDFSANAGQPPRALAKVASGGELSRVSLAVQLIANSSRAAATLIFDEVDAGVGGGTAEIVGEKLRALAARRQVMCVTHLPQVAAQGQHHYAIAKETRGSKTRTLITPLDPDGRVAELARMLGGREITKSTQAHAREMLKKATSS